MRISGVIDRSMGNFFCLRGFAPMLQLANVSETIEGLQRDLMNEHRGEMEKFLKSGTFTFFPEVVLCVDLKANEATDSEKGKFYEAVKNKQSLRTAKCGNFSISVSNYTRKSKIENRTQDTIQSSFIDFDENKIKRFLRIDGNHRLSAVDKNSSYKDTIIPFCLIFFYGAEDTDKFCRALFHNINTKQIPLRMDENLKVIIEGENVFSDEELRNDASFGLHYLCTREICKGANSVNLDHFPLVKKFIGQSKYTYFESVFYRLLREQLLREENDPVGTLSRSITNINTALEQSQITEITENIAILGAMTVYKLQPDQSKYKSFISWVRKNNIGLAKNLHIDDVMSIFDSVYENIPKRVFLARWYPAVTNSEFNAAQNRLNAMGKIVEKFKLKLIDIGTQEGGTFAIREEMYQLINESDIFIADLTGARHNVMVEVGYALKNVGRKRILFYYMPTTECQDPPFDINGFRCEKISEAADLENAVSKHIEAILRGAEIGEV